MSEDRLCVACLAHPPDSAEGDLITTRFGWRLTRRLDPRTNETILEWRCPTCAARSRKLRALGAGPSGTFRAVTESPPDSDGEGDKKPAR